MAECLPRELLKQVAEIFAGHGQTAVTVSLLTQWDSRPELRTRAPARR